ncbi:MAG: hypothetical protein HQK97_12225, partial [Nitrospirae bacterium]|nr:hypothetical protein [Nitrospirota bacterium]
MRHRKILEAALMAVIILTSTYMAEADSTGSMLFSTYCISCHNTIPTTDPRLIGASAAKITNAIATISQMVGNSALKTLSSAQIQSISDYIVGVGMSSNWTRVGLGDFNGAGSQDIVWRDPINGYNY